MSIIAKTVGQRLRRRRIELGYSQEAVSEKAGLHPTYIGQLERGEKNATLESIEKICIALEYPMEELFEKIVPVYKKENIADQCYELILSKHVKYQHRLYLLLKQIVEYKAGS